MDKGFENNAAQKGVSSGSIEFVVAETISKVLNISMELIHMDANINDLPRIESIKLLRVIAKIEDRYDIEIDDSVLSGVSTVGNLVNEIKKALKGTVHEQA